MQGDGRKDWEEGRTTREGRSGWSRHGRRRRAWALHPLTRTREHNPAFDSDWAPACHRDSDGKDLLPVRSCRLVA